MFAKVLLKCEWIDYVPSIVPEVYDIICPAPLENIEEKLDALCDKVEDIQEAVQECYGKEKEQGKKVERKKYVKSCSSKNSK